MTIEKPKISVAFICLGNFCRSPMAEAIFKHEVEKANLENRFNKIDSFGTSNYHVGESPDHRTVSICKQHGVKINHKGKQIKTKHFDEYDYIIGMDESNINNLKKYNLKVLKLKFAFLVIGILMMALCRPLLKILGMVTYKISSTTSNKSPISPNSF
ncbi:Ltp1p [Saccharomyces cerevisiae P301]|nr:Ltp1p [Saccharomyces cerevisiae P301]KQC40681.1 LTP1p phosphotyrosine phosphatase [Saccharomyces boulardii (nom. inval.)]